MRGSPRVPYHCRRNIVLVSCATALLVLFVLLLPESAYGGSDVLAPDRPVEKALSGGEQHTYVFRANAGQFVHVTVEQMGIDVEVRMFDPAGKEICNMDTLNGSFGPEKLSAIARLSGNYKLRIASGDKSLPAGRYRLTMDAVRPPTASDRQRIAAERMIMAGITAETGRNAAALNKAVAKFMASVPLWESLGDAYEEALALDMAASDLEDLGQREKTLEIEQKSLALYRQIHEPRGEATALNNIGHIQSMVGDKQKALATYEQALAIWDDLLDKSGQAVTLNNIGAIYDDLGDKHKALTYYEKALPLRREIRDRLGEAATLNNVAIVYHAMGEMQSAREQYEAALPIWREIGDKNGEAATLNNIGRVYGDLGEEPRALEFYAQALPLRRQIGDKFGEGATLNNLGLAHEALQQWQTALDYYKLALPLEREVEDRYGEGRTLSNIGHVYAMIGETDRALEYYQQALPLHDDVGDRTGQARTLSDIGALYASRGEREKALEQFTAALALFRAVQDPLGQGRTLTELMRFWRQSGELPAAVFFGKQAVNQYQQVRSNIRKFERETQASFRNAQGSAYRDLADLLIAQGRLPEAQQVLDLLKDEEYFEFTRRDSKNADTLTAPVAFTREEEELRKRFDANATTITALGEEWAGLRTRSSRTPEEEKHLKQLTEQLKTANAAWTKFLDDIYLEISQSKQSQVSAQSLQENASALQRVVRQLGPGTVALYTLVGETKYHVILVTPTVEVAREYPITAAALNKKIAAFRNALLDPRADPAPAAKELYTILVGPVASEIAGAHATTLMWSLDGVLRYVPMSALHDGHGYMVEKFRTLVFTPASIPTLTAHPMIAQWNGIGMGVSKAYGGMVPLPEVPSELHGIIRETTGAGGVLAGRTLLDDAFTEETLKRSLTEKFPVIHIASHFVFGEANDTDSYLLLGGKSEQGQRLTLADINNDPEISFDDVELLTLSACNTALSLPSDGREVDGLGMLAQRKGARAVMATLWSVYDPSTSAMMKTFYRNWTSESHPTKAEALREAQLEFLQGSTYAHPYYWAPFILIGNGL